MRVFNCAGEETLKMFYAHAQLKKGHCGRLGTEANVQVCLGQVDVCVGGRGMSSNFSDSAVF